MRKLLMLLCLLLLPVSVFAQAPTLFFTDITSGPKTGGENGNGAFVTIYGNNFGTVSSVTVGGGAAIIKLQPSVWLWYQRMTIQLGAAATTGNIVVNNARGASNGLPFTVRSGNIFFAGTLPGDVSSVVACKNGLAAGDICYVRNGMNVTGTEDFNASIIFGASSTAANPRALITYPGATSTIGAPSQTRGFYFCSGLSACTNGSGWVLAGFTVRGGENIAVGVDSVRIVAIDLSCPQGNGSTGCFESEVLTNGTILGAHVHDSGVAGADKTYHSIYYGTNSNHSEVGWSQVHDGGACRGIQFHSTGGADMFDLHVHDNRVFNTVCDGINFASTNPSNGVVEAYNNVVYHAGTGPDPGGGSSDYACFQLSNSSATVSIKIYNNTMFDCGSRGNVDSGAITILGKAALFNNIIKQKSGEVFITPGGLSPAGNLTGSNNIWTGVSGAPTQTTNNLTTDPQWTNEATFDFTIPQTSPANGSGDNANKSTLDVAGKVRPNPPSRGAYEASSAAAPPQPPTGLTVIVH